MAGTARQAPDPVALERALREQPEGFEFFEALRRLECAHPDRPRLGESAKPSEDAVRLCHTPSLEFSPRAVDRYEPAAGGRPPRLHGLFLGLFGPNGPLPLHLTEYAIDRRRNAKDPTLVAFADIFHHRMLSLFYRAWASAQPTVQLDRPGEDRFSLYMGALVGLSTRGLEGRDAMPDQYKRFFAGRLQAQARNAEGLGSLLVHFFGIPVRVVEFVASWMRLPREAHLRLGSSPEVAGLGRTAVIGEYVWGSQQRFRLRLGPLTRAQFNNFLPGGEALRQLVAAVKTYVGEEKAWDVQLVLKRAEVPSTKLGLGGRMGLTTWIGEPRRDADADHVILRPVG
ncbi:MULTISPECIES: type VI secretion system baseplate subunit TssG [Rhodanobacter]|uniref:Type VI secretion system baseplate subunit TssG n=1 Tax=Rhodanobacter hydrolyticus TaxID=2250595 RepID=A0ABW8JAX5_9GAMM|nr:type VI secretion system baseplate subunit TssG [Rhodanobacter sp. 7MK24]MBD8880162.1 type VI secretion system baseplate subunit TssG [Rhodanobacter sp. 7MK24]